MEHRYEYEGTQYILKKNGTKDTPWNIYEIVWSDWVGKFVEAWWGYGKTLKQCKADIRGEF